MRRQHTFMLATLVWLAAAGGCEEGLEACHLVEVEDKDEGWPDETDDHTVCRRDGGLVAANDGADLLEANSVALSQAHCGGIWLTFRTGEGWCYSGDVVATVHLIANGKGTYETGEGEVGCKSGDAPTPGSFALSASRGNDVKGSGVIRMDSDVKLDLPFTRGAADLRFDDGTRLLVDFAAPLCMSE